MRRFVLITLFFFAGLATTERAAWSAPESDDPLLLEESQIVAPKSASEEEGGAGRSELPSLSTDLPWEEEAGAERLNIPREILGDLTQPDPSDGAGEWMDLLEGEEP
ncbi:MAG TPA: hypothetical protein VI382_05005 [Candidatus Manganitrophaceae bacterium]|nr:hypothetical protein [Candidatus Manganitrophaceae bacterium]